MKQDRIRNAHAVLLPAFDSLSLSDAVKRFLGKGGCSILLGESRQEYVAREMGEERKAAETAEMFLSVNQEASKLAGGLLVAVDQEIAGIRRLHDLAPPFPAKSMLATMDADSFEETAYTVAAAARGLGINMFLAPILDVVTGENPWLSGRTWSIDAEAITRISSAFIRGVQAAGVAATAKHFPGFHNIPLDPAIHQEAKMSDAADSFEEGFKPFIEATASGVELIMVGPAVVEAFDREKPASISAKVIGLLRRDIGFKGVVLSDDLDSQATMKGRPVPEVAVDALKAGSDFLLLADVDDQLDEVADAISTAVETGDLAEERLEKAATKVRSLAERYAV